MADVRMTASKAIRAKCLDCTNNQIAEVRNCSIKRCALWRYRMGREQRDELYVRKARSGKYPENTGVFEESEVD